MSKEKRVLIAEDEVLVARYLVMELEKAGHTVCAFVASGEEAVQQAGVHHPDCLIMDINLNGAVNGIDAVEKIRETMKIPVIFMTGYTRGEFYEAARRLNPAAYLKKPIETDELISILNRL